MAKPQSLGFRLRGVAGIVAFLPVAFAIAVSRPLKELAPGTWGGLALDVAGWLCFLAGVFLRLSSIVFVGGRKGKSLVTNGPYSCCRNPLYLGSLMIALSATLLLHSVTAVAGILLAGIFYVTVVIPSEEKQLAAAFPEDWARYIAEVPRLVPRFAWKAGVERIEVDLRALRNEGLRVMGMGLMPALVHVFWHLRAQNWWTPWWTLP